MEHVQRALPNAGVARIEYRMMWPERGTPPEALAEVRREMWAAWAAEDIAGWKPPAEAPADIAVATRELADRFHARFRVFREKLPDDAAVWSDVRKVDMVARVGKLLSITVRREWRTGGARPSRAVRHLIFDAATGRRLGVEDFFPGDRLPDLARLVREALLAKQSLPPTASMAEAGFFADTRPGAANFFVDLRGVGFAFNESEIAPQAAGPIEVVLPFDALRGLFRPEAATLMPTPAEIDAATPKVRTPDSP